MTKPYQCPPQHYEPLGFVTTISEAAQHWQYSRYGVRYAIDAGNLAAVQSGRTWLISVPSLVAYWGYPPALLGTSDYANGQETPLQITREGGIYVARHG